MSDFTKNLGALLAKNKKKPILWYDINKGYYHKEKPSCPGCRGFGASTRRRNREST